MDDCAQLTDDCAQLMDDCAHLTDDCAHLPDDCAQLMGDCAHLTDDCAVFPDDCAHLLGDSSTLTDDCSTLPDDCSHLTDGSSTLLDDSSSRPGARANYLGAGTRFAPKGAELPGVRLNRFPSLQSAPNSETGKPGKVRNRLIVVKVTMGRRVSCPTSQGNHAAGRRGACAGWGRRRGWPARFSCGEIRESLTVAPAAGWRAWLGAPRSLRGLPPVGPDHPPRRASGNLPASRRT